MIDRRHLKAVRPLLAVTLAVWMATGCASKAVVAPAPAELPPGYVQVPHPEGLDYADLVAIFTDPSAPSPDELKKCDGSYQRLKEATTARRELDQGAVELVSEDPIRMHWCFYSKLYSMENTLRDTAYLDERQRTVLETYRFVAPISRAFLSEYKDSRYLRWAVTRYQRLSEYVFFRKLDVSPEGSRNLAGMPRGGYGDVRKSPDSSKSILLKYGIVKAEDVVAQSKTAAGEPVSGLGGNAALPGPAPSQAAQAPAAVTPPPTAPTP